MKRPHFQDGRVLRTSDFVDEQAYHQTAHRLHNTTSHLWGIAAGLDLVLLDGNPVVEPGLAVDGYGRDVVLDHAWPLDLRGYDVRGVASVDVWIAYARTPLPSTGDGVDLYLDSAVVELRDEEQVDPRRPPGVSLADLAHAGSPPDDPARRWPIYLGRLTRDLSDPTAPPLADTDRRVWIGLVGAAVQTPTGEEWLTFTPGPDAGVSVGLPGKDNSGVAVGLPARSGSGPPLRISATEGVVLDARLTVGGELALEGGPLVIGPPVSPGEPEPPDTPEWSVSHVAGDVTHELRIALPQTDSDDPPHRLVVGVWQNDAFLPRLVVNGDGTVLIAGNLVVDGTLTASSVQEAQLSAEARAYLAGLQATTLLSLFEIVAPSAPIN